MGIEEAWCTVPVRVSMLYFIYCIYGVGCVMCSMSCVVRYDVYCACCRRVLIHVCLSVLLSFSLSLYLSFSLSFSLTFPPTFPPLPLPQVLLPP